MNMSLGLTNQHISRQLDIIPTHILDKQISIIGAGAIGSWTCLSLAKMGFHNISVIDFDKVDIVNMSSQFYGVKDVERPKVFALQSRIREMSGTEIKAYLDKWPTPFTWIEQSNVVILAVDSMKVRKEVYEYLKDKTDCFLIDARMGAETAMIYTINPMIGSDHEMYEKTLYSDENAVQAPCTAKSTTYCSLVLSGFVAKTVSDVLLDKPFMRAMNLCMKSNLMACLQGNLT
jgi:molybdopterin/thiamine biosynthesis adenylyltransferase